MHGLHRSSYDIGVYVEGKYEEIFNSDKDVYGGANQYNGLPVQSTPFGPYDKPHKITIKLASFGAAIFKLKKEKIKNVRKRKVN